MRPRRSPEATPEPFLRTPLPVRLRWRKGTPPPVLVEVHRGNIVEARHRGSVVEVGPDGSVGRIVGDAGAEVMLRSCAKPFGLIALIESGAADAFELTPPELAVLASSHSGEDLHVRTLQAILRRAGISQSLLACGVDAAPLDALTASRLARDGERPGPIRHMCSGHHVAYLLLARHSDWPLDDYWRPEHPSQAAVRSAVARAFGAEPDRLVSAVDACGIETYSVPLVEVARAFALLADPPGVALDIGRRPLVTPLMRIRDAMLAAPDLVAGTRDRLDSALMRAVPGRLVAKGGAEGLRGIALLPDSRGHGWESGGIAVKIEDGDALGRAGASAAVEALRQSGVLQGESLRRLASFHRPLLRDPRGAASGEVVPVFDLAPVHELT
jgi:L-asparaginase II